MGVGDGEQGRHLPPPPKNGGKLFFAQLCKIRVDYFVDFSHNYHVESEYFVIFLRKYHVKFMELC